MCDAQSQGITSLGTQSGRRLGWALVKASRREAIEDESGRRAGRDKEGRQLPSKPSSSSYCFDRGPKNSECDKAPLQGATWGFRGPAWSPRSHLPRSPPRLRPHRPRQVSFFLPGDLPLFTWLISTRFQLCRPFLPSFFQQVFMGLLGAVRGDGNTVPLPDGNRPKRRRG